jgi:dihydrofolate synthase/folylpolyglutamate synthase
MDYQMALEDLKAIEPQGIHLGLENTRTILDHLPIDIGRTPFIQVAGTNGKGSTAHFLAAIFQAGGYTVGLFTSPHLQDVRERISINRRWISGDDFAASYWPIKNLSLDLLKKGLIAHMPTYFEQLFLTAVHYFFFPREVPGIIILEVGLGGRLDATSTIRPEVSVITNIARDHTIMLGTRLRDIAAEKAGIIKAGVPVVCGCKVGSTAHRVIRKTARQNRAPFFNVIDAKNHLQIRNNCKTDGDSYQCTYTAEAETYTFNIRLNGSHQAANAAAAIKTLQVLQNKNTISISRQSICEGTANTVVPARIEIIAAAPQIILDGGHNVDSIAALTHFLREKKKRSLTLIFGVLADKNYRKMILLLLPHIKTIILTEPHSERALPAEKILKFLTGNHKLKPVPLDNRKIFIKNNLEDAYAAARQFNRDILVTGSFYLVGAMRNMIIRRIRWPIY